MIIVVHSYGQEIIGEEEMEVKDDSQIFLKKPFIINREHVSMQDSIGTILLLDSIGSEVKIPRVQSWPRPASPDELKSYNHICEQMSPIIRGKPGDLKLINRE